jgi:hypothetical protein
MTQPLRLLPEVRFQPALNLTVIEAIRAFQP